MAQHDYSIANQDFPSTRTDINNALQAILTRNSGATAPSTTAAGLQYRDTDDDWVYERNAADSAWLKLYKIGKQGLIPQDGATIYAVATGVANTLAVTLDPAPTALVDGMVVNFRANNANTGAATLNVNSLGAKAIVKNFNAALTANDILAGQIVTVAYDSANDRFQMLSASAQSSGASVPRGYIAGLTLSNNVSDANNDIDIAVGTCRDSTNAHTLTLAATLTKRLDASWEVGTGNGGIDTGSKANSTTYHIHLIRRDSDGVIDALFSTSATAPSMPSGWTARRRLGAVITDGSGNIRGFYQIGDTFLWNNRIADVDVTSLGTSATLYTLTVPAGVRVGALLFTHTTKASTEVAVLITSPDTTDQAPTSSLFTNYGSTTGTNGQGHSSGIFWTNTSGQVRARSNAVSTTAKFVTAGYIDPRGRFD